ncbi:hypothetical protein N7492_009994 [Penicillium capsulatum]|uniref:Glutamine amidotransferase domain-containing protein n=1 Tax=Penicillium capsulatum TaxID=69766 RepID=A0A9W9HML0_9EURO|nr:hypothetical protein N7492_009994 [Penicillium capsulatum]KAJ6112503.1 hypothetical protein N7512_007827 [Penicillium capsulatum]
MTHPLRIAVLECDTPIAPVVAKLGTYGDIFEGLLTRGTQATNPTTEVEISKWNVVDNPDYPNPHGFDGFLLTGSKHDAFGDDQWITSLTEYVRNVLQSHRKPVVGICFGHQILARALGARVGRGEGWEVSVEKISMTDAGKALFLKEELYLHQMHRDIVFEVPQGCTNLGFSPRCGVQGLYKPGQVLSIQAHPEFNDFVMSKILEMRHAKGVFSEEMYQDGLARSKKEHDGEMFGQRIIEFLLEAA